MKVPHKHAEVIKAWADGATIQYLRDPGIRDQWCDLDARLPPWHAQSCYRVKPEPKPDIIHKLGVRLCSDDKLYHMWNITDKNIELIFDGETRNLKDVRLVSSVPTL